jgi:hypothetical protein
MKECWINVYYVYGKSWLGNYYPKRCIAEHLANRNLIYRIHVRMK